MHINIETAELHAIQAYDNQKIQINSVIYQSSVLVSREKIISDLQIKKIADIKEEHIKKVLTLNPEVLIIGHSDLGSFPALESVAQLSQQGIGVECMSLGAACRTYNILLSEHRAVIGLFILDAVLLKH